MHKKTNYNSFEELLKERYSGLRVADEPYPCQICGAPTEPVARLDESYCPNCRTMKDYVPTEWRK